MGHRKQQWPIKGRGKERIRTSWPNGILTISLQSILTIPFHLWPGLFLSYFQTHMIQAFSVFFIRATCIFFLVNHTINIWFAFIVIICNSVFSADQPHEDTFSIQHFGHFSAHCIYTSVCSQLTQCVWCQRNSQQSQTVSGVLPQCRSLATCIVMTDCPNLPCP
jgi:TctA family transporter